MTVARRGVWTLADHVVSSGGNFLLVILVARNVPVTTLGAFALLYGFYVVAVELSRALVSEPLLVRRPDPGSALRRAMGDSSGSAAVLGVLAGVVLLALSPLLLGPHWQAALVLAPMLPVLLVQDALRMGFICAGQPARAVLNDAVWVVTQLAVIFAVLTVSTDLRWLVAGWCLGGLVAACLGTAQAGVLPRLGAPRRWMREYGRLARPYFAETAVLAVAGYAVLIVVGEIAGPAEVGAMRAALTLFGPANVVMAAGRVAAVGELSRINRAGGRGLPRAAATAALLCAVAGGAAGLVALVLPDGAGRALLGQSWPAVIGLIPAYTVLLTVEGLGIGPYAVLRVLERLRMLFLLRVCLALGKVAVASAGAALAGALGAVAATAALESAGVLCALALTASALAARRPQSPEHPPTTAAPRPASRKIP